MRSQTKSASGRHYSFRISYSKTIFKLEVLLTIISFYALLMVSDDLWFVPCLMLCVLIAFIFFSSYSTIRQYPKGLTVEFRASPDRLIWYYPATEICFLSQDVEFRMTRWFVLLKMVNTTNQWYRVVLQDSFDDIEQYTHFRQHLRDQREQ